MWNESHPLKVYEHVYDQSEIYVVTAKVNRGT